MAITVIITIKKLAFFIVFLFNIVSNEAEI